MHYHQNFKSRSDAHLLKWMNTVETAVDQLFYCQSSAKAQKKSNILFWNQSSGISWKQNCQKRKLCSDREGQIKMLLRSTRCTLVCSSTLNCLLTHNKYLTIKVRWKSFMGSPLVCSSTLNWEMTKLKMWKTRQIPEMCEKTLIAAHVHKIMFSVAFSSEGNVFLFFSIINMYRRSSWLTTSSPFCSQLWKRRQTNLISILCWSIVTCPSPWLWKRETFLHRPEVVEDSKKCYLPCLDDLQSTWWPAISKFLTVVTGELLLFHLIWFHRVPKNLIYWIR